MLAVREKEPQNAPETASCSAQQQQTSYFQQTNRKSVFSCLFTKQKTQKRKKWHDGRLVVSGSAVLYHADPPPGSGDPVLDQCELSTRERDAIFASNNCHLETEKFLITIEGPWIGPSPNYLPKIQPVVSNSMAKVMTKKFRKPSHAAPPPPQLRPANPNLAKRRRLLQPGELMQQYYGNSQNQPMSQQTEYASDPRHQSFQQNNNNEWKQPPSSAQQQHWGHGSRTSMNNPPPYNNQTGVTAPQDHSSVPSNPYQGQDKYAGWSRPPHNDSSAFAPSQTPNNPYGRARGTDHVISHEQWPVHRQARSFEPPTTSGTNKGLFPAQGNQRAQPVAPRPTLFAGNNGFDASNFYGDDEEEDDDEAPNPHQLTEPNSSFGWTPPAASPEPSKEALSDSQILDLFSASNVATNPPNQSTEASPEGDSFVLPDDSSDEDSD